MGFKIVEKFYKMLCEIVAEYFIRGTKTGKFGFWAQIFLTFNSINQGNIKKNPQNRVKEET